MAIDTAIRRNAAFLDQLPLPNTLTTAVERSNIVHQYFAARTSSVDPLWRMEIYDPADTATPVAVLDPTMGAKVWNPKWRHPYKGIGSGEFYLQNDDPRLNVIEQGFLVRCYKGTTAVFEWIVGPMLRHSVAKAAATGVPSGEKYTQVSGLGSKAYGARSPIQPWRGGRAQPKETVRPFDWTSPHFEASGYPLDGWEFATAFARVDGPSAHWEGTPEAVPDNMIYWVGAGSVGDDDDAVEGVQLIRFPPQTLDEDQLVRFLAWDDNEGIVSLNGTPILFLDGFHVARYIDLPLVAGDYYPSMFLRNHTPTATSSTNNPAGGGFGMYEMTSGGSYVRRIYVSNVDAQVLALPDITPGMPIGYAVRKLRNEAQDRGEMPGLTVGFTNTEDSASSTFPATDPGALVGESFTDYLLALEDAVVDAEMSPGLELNLWYPKGSRAVATDVTFTEGVSLHKLDHELRDDRIDKLFVDYDGGYVEVFSTGIMSGGIGEYSRNLKLSQVNSEDAAVRISEEILAGRDVPSVQFTADIHTGEGREPYQNFKPGDTVTVDDIDGTPAVRTVQAIIFAGVDKAGNPLWAAEFGDMLEPFDTVAERAVKRFTATRGATNIHSGAPTINGSGGQEYKWQIMPFTYEPSDLQISQKDTAPSTRDLAFLEVQLDEPDVEDHTFTVKVNGSTVTGLTSTIAAGNDYVRTWLDIPSLTVTAPSDKITLEFSGDPVRFTAKLAFR